MGAAQPEWKFPLSGGRATQARALVCDDDVANLQELFEMLPSYCENTIGFPPGPAEAHSTLIARPPSSDPDDKVPLGVFDDGRLVGFCDLVLEFPQPSRCYIGFVLVHPAYQRQGLGSSLLRFSTTVAQSQQPRCTHAVTGLIETFGQQAQDFLERCGFAPTGSAEPYEVNTISSTRHEYSKVL